MKINQRRGIRKPIITEQRVKKIRSLPQPELDKMLNERTLQNYLGIKKLAVHGRTSGKRTLNFYLAAAGKRGIKGTIVGDCLKLIAEGKLDEVQSKRNKYGDALRMLGVAGIMDRKGKIDINAVKKSLDENRILHKGEW